MAVVLVGALLVQALVVAASSDDACPAALVLFLLGLLAGWAGLVVPHFWRSSVEWRQKTPAAGGLNRRLGDRLVSRTQPTDSAAWQSSGRCSECGQMGPNAVPRVNDTSQCTDPSQVSHRSAANLSSGDTGVRIPHRSDIS